VITHTKKGKKLNFLNIDNKLNKVKFYEENALIKHNKIGIETNFLRQSLAQKHIDLA